MATSKPVFWLGLFLIVFLAGARGNAIRDVESYKSTKLERSIIDYRISGMKFNVKIVPAANESSSTSRSGENDGFPAFPFKEVGRCLLELSLTCVQKRVARFLDVVGHLPEITLFGQKVKLVKLKELPAEVDEQRMIMGVSEKIDKSIDDFFDTFALRITLPKRNGKNSQIDVMMDNTDVVEGRGDKGGGGGGKKGGGKGGGKGGKGGGGCKKMMMMMVVGLKMKMMGMIGMAAMKGMFMSGMSLMISKMMLLQKVMSMKGGMFGGFGGGGGGSQGQLKEIILLTKASGGGGGGGGGGSYSPPPDTYGAPPPTGGGGGGGYDYSGGGGGGGGGGWGRSFDRAPMTVVRDYTLEEPEHEQTVITSQVVDGPMGVKLISDDKWNDDDSWKYATDPVVADQIKASQILEENQEKNRRDQFNSFTRPIYAQEWKNYIVARRHKRGASTRLVM